MNKLMICSSWFGHLLNVSPLCGLYPVADALVLPISSDRCPDNGALYAGQSAASHAFNSLKGHSNEKGFFSFLNLKRLLTNQGFEFCFLFVESGTRSGRREEGVGGRRGRKD
jgi:hypothetical protein